MAFVHRQSCEGVKTELDLFTVPPTQTCIVESHVEEHQPTASLDSGGPIEFFIPGSGDDYMDLANTMLHLQVKVTRANGNPIDAGEPVGPVNNWLHALFSNVDLSLNNTQRDLFVLQRVPVSSLHRDAVELRIRRQVDADDESAVVQGQGQSHARHRASRRTRS